MLTKTKYIPQDLGKCSSHINGNQLDIFKKTTGHFPVGLVATNQDIFLYDFGTACS